MRTKEELIEEINQAWDVEHGSVRALRNIVEVLADIRDELTSLIEKDE